MKFEGFRPSIEVLRLVSRGNWMNKKLLTFLLFLSTTNQLDAFAATQVINDADKYKPVSLNEHVTRVNVNTTGAQLDLTHFKDGIVVNGNGNQIVAGVTESLTLIGTGNSIDLVDGNHVTKIRQGQDLYQQPSALKFYDLDASSASGIKIKQVKNAEN